MIRVPSGNSAVGKSSRKGFFEVYDRGELLFLIARSVVELDACVTEAQHAYDLTDDEVAAVLSMAD
jgi:hypothetical protein